MNQRVIPALRPALLAAALSVAVIALLPAGLSAQGFKWWQTERFQRELQLTPEQIAKIEETFQSAVPELRQQKKALDKLEQDLARLIDTTADEAVVMQQADRVEKVRAELSKARTRMLLRMRRVLSADQRAKLVALHDEWERNRKRQDRRK
jgi:Spy/CpxP family protein refolding chaperone